jgi:hypothetical protein
VKPRKVEAKVEPYTFSAAFARIVAFYATTSTRFWSMVAAELMPAGMPDAPTRLIVETVRAHSLATGFSPGSVTLVVQLIRRQVNEGAVEYALAQEAYDALEDVEDLPAKPDVDAVLAVVIPELRSRLRQQVAYQAAEDYAKNRTDFADTIALIQRVRSVGVLAHDVGYSLGAASIEQVLQAVSALDYMSTGNVDLDMLIGGGLRRGCLGAFVGGTGAGKSMSIYHMVVQACAIGSFGCIATLELGCADVVARCVANATGISTHTVVASPKDAARVYADLGMGPLFVKDFPPRVTAFEEIAVWVDRCEQRVGRKLDVLGTDYGDKLTVAKGTRVKDQYEAQGVVWDAMRQYAHDRAMFHVSASQAKTRDRSDRKRLLNEDDLADSKNKSRSLDSLFGVNTSEDFSSCVWNVIKNRHGGGAGTSTAPLPTDFAHGRVVVLNDFRAPSSTAGAAEDW